MLIYEYLDKYHYHYHHRTYQLSLFFLSLLPLYTQVTLNN